MKHSTKLTKSKILATLGPSTNTMEDIRKLSEIGVDCTRINFSHGDAEQKREIFKNVREANKKLAILCDIQGPKIRIGEMKGKGSLLNVGKNIIVTTEIIEGDAEKVTISYPELPKEVEKGELIYINDGIICLEVVDVKGNEINCTIMAGGHLTSRKGVNLPSTEISLSVPTTKDKEDLKLIAELDPEYVAISFVKSAEDVKNIRDLLKSYGNGQIKLIAKIERPVALENFDSILEASDGIMVARGDLGVEIPPEDVIPAQKEMVRKCNIAGKPVIVATQMLESMVKNPVPTRAEASDVYNAIADGADAVMLSAETASGDYPENAVAIMERIIRTSESLSLSSKDPDDYDSDNETYSEIIGHLVYSASKEFCEMDCYSGKIICITESGYTGQMISKYRPFLPIIGITSDIRVSREMKLLWGIEALLIEDLHKETDPFARIKMSVKRCLEEDYIDDIDQIIVAGNIFNLKSQTNMVSVFSVSDVMG
ncbi:MAG: pyruvate kinase [Desulfobacterales bacterium]|nr:pyruvate kinase [Desulfobacterales bacterium]MCP4159010.1 pyruvate kinase [Deltaproteobacteria bacterium]